MGKIDHADDEASIQAALSAGVDGVMADGSGYPLDENMVWTARMAALAHASGATVEAELGRLAGEEDGLSIDEKDAKMTDPAVVGRFLAATSVDALAVTIGNVHGKYAKAEPELDWPRLDAVRDAAGGRHGTPLVLHGASGLPEPMVHRAIAAGVTKFNVNTEVRAAAREAAAAAAAAGRDVLATMEATTEAASAAAETEAATETEAEAAMSLSPNAHPARATGRRMAKMSRSKQCKRTPQPSSAAGESEGIVPQPRQTVPTCSHDERRTPNQRRWSDGDPERRLGDSK